MMPRYVSVPLAFLVLWFIIWEPVAINPSFHVAALVLSVLNLVNCAIPSPLAWRVKG